MYQSSFKKIPILGGVKESMIIITQIHNCSKYVFYLHIVLPTLKGEGWQTVSLLSSSRLLRHNIEWYWGTPTECFLWIWLLCFVGHGFLFLAVVKTFGLRWSWECFTFKSVLTIVCQKQILTGNISFFWFCIKSLYEEHSSPTWGKFLCHFLKQISFL